MVFGIFHGIFDLKLQKFLLRKPPKIVRVKLNSVVKSVANLFNPAIMSCLQKE